MEGKLNMTEKMQRDKEEMLFTELILNNEEDGEDNDATREELEEVIEC